MRGEGGGPPFFPPLPRFEPNKGPTQTKVLHTYRNSRLTRICSGYTALSDVIGPLPLPPRTNTCPEELSIGAHSDHSFPSHSPTNFVSEVSPGHFKNLFFGFHFGDFFFFFLFVRTGATYRMHSTSSPRYRRRWIRRAGDDIAGSKAEARGINGVGELVTRGGWGTREK